MSELPFDKIGELSAGTLEVRLALSDAEKQAAQALRYQVFVQDMGAGASEAMHAAARDEDHYDAVCDHLLVLEHASGKAEVVGTYRLIRREAAMKIGHFYSAAEYDISAIEAFTEGNLLELGRSCVHRDYRNRAVMQLLWRGIGAYVARHKIGLMFGCASFPGRNPADHADTLSYLHHYHLAPPELRMRALPERYTEMNLMPKDAIHAKRAFAKLPPLIKGYLRLGGFVGDGAVIDHDYNTVDVGIVVKTALVTDKYVARYGQSDGEQ